MKRILLTLILALPMMSMAQSEHQDLYFHADATTFFRDAEYFMPFTKGYTISGFRVTPSLDYHIGSKVKMRAGFMATGVAGTDGFRELKPVFTMSYFPNSWFSIHMGTIKGSKLYNSEPMIDYERHFIDYQEDGLELFINTAKYDAHTWVNWENFLEPWTPDQERFTLGSFHIFDHLDKGNRLSLRLNFLGSHRGGQFTALDTCIETLFNEQIGVHYRFGSDDQRTHPILSADAYLFQNASPTPYTAFTQGWAVFPQVVVYHFLKPTRTNHFLFQLGYWHGNQYQSARGSWLYQSVSWHNPTFTQPMRRMIVLGGEYTSNLSHTPFTLSLKAKAYYDLDLGDTDFVVTLLMNFSSRYKIWSNLR